MKITKDELVTVARLARLDINEETLEKFTGQVGKILDYMETLNQVDTEGIEPTSHAISLTNAFREDIPAPSISNESALSNAPEEEDGSFVVTKVIG